MKTFSVTNKIRKYPIIAGLASLPLLFIPLQPHAQNLEKTPDRDLFEKNIPVPPKGTEEDTILLGAPSPETEIAGVKTTAKIVVDISKNVLYTYDKSGHANCAYLIASGKKSSPTDTGIMAVTHVETYPYKSAPLKTRRRRRPNDYGPKIICLEKVDAKTGERSMTGKFIHGTNKPASLGEYASLGCMRMDNEVIKFLAKEVKKGDIVLIIK